MHALVVVAHHDPKSLSHACAAHVAAGIASADQTHTYEIADLSAEGFDPRFNLADHAVHRTQSRPPPEVAAEQARIDRADALVLVYPVYWWSMPAILKGWIDRVFANGWAFDFRPDLPLVKKLGRLRVHLVGLAGADEATYSRHGYDSAMRTQIDHGIFDFCGACVVTSDLLLESEVRDPATTLQAARAIGERVFRTRAECEVVEPA